MKLYKYMTMDNFIKFQKNKALRLTKSHSQNDPFEFLLNSDDLNSLFRNENGKQLLMKHINMSGCVSMSVNKDSIYMWSHYSDNHRGVCVEFTISENEPKSLFNGGANVYQGSYIKSPTGFFSSSVSYDNSRRVIVNNESRGNLLEEAIRTIYFLKSKDWDKESEYRFILPFVEACEIFLTEKGLKEILSRIDFEGFEVIFVECIESGKYVINGLNLTILISCGYVHVLHKIWEMEGNDCIFLVKMNIDKLTGIYFGCRSELNKCGDINDLSNFNGKFYSLIDDAMCGVYKASVDKNEFKLNFSRLNNVDFGF